MTTEIGPVCPGYHNGQASSRWMDEDRCTTCDGYKPPVTVPECDCEPTTWDDGSVSHEDDCPLYPWCPHEIAATCSMPCLCRCDGCMALTLGNQPTTSPATRGDSLREFDQALQWDDWETRRTLFDGMDLLDTDKDPRAESAFYLLQDHLKRLNSTQREPR